MRIQTRVKNRKRLSPAVLKKVAEIIERLAIQHDVSKSFVVSTILADALNIEQEKYYDQRKATRKSKVKTKSNQSSNRTNRIGVATKRNKTKSESNYQVH